MKTSEYPVWKTNSWQFFTQTASLKDWDKSPIGHFTVVYLVAKPLIMCEAEDDLVMIEINI